MRIGINASSISAVKGGVSFYIVNIITSLAAIDTKNTYTVFVSPTGTNYFKNLPANFTFCSDAPKKVVFRLIWEQLFLPIVCKWKKIDVLFCPNYTCPIIKLGFKTVVTIHDLSFFPMKELYPPSRRIFKYIIKLSVASADKVIAVSNHTKMDIVKYVNQNQSKIEVVYNAAHEKFSETVPMDKIDTAKAKYKIPGNYILFIGFLEPRKNLIRLMDAFFQICSTVVHTLVIAGGDGWWFETTYQKAKQFSCQNRIVFTGYVEDDDLPALYAGADIFVFPSLYEGFGIAALESVSCGTPVLASNNSSLPEVVGQAGVYVDPFDANNIAEKMLKVLKNPSILADLKSHCAEQASKFSWEKSARETLGCLVSK